VTIEVVLLALASTVRPMSLAAVYALVSRVSPRRLMIAYIAGGLLFTVAFGLLVLWAFNGISVHSGTDEAKGIVEITCGVAALLFGVLLRTGRIGRGSQVDDAPEAPARWQALLERGLTAKAAALLGPVTHIPGLFYLVALNVIAAHQPSVAGGLAEVLIYNAVWFAVPIAALAICVVDPQSARRAVDALQTWALSHSRGLLQLISFVAGAALVVRGVLAL
jgi:hypothetical protein